MTHAASLIETDITRARDVLGVHIDIRPGDEIVAFLDERIATGRPLQVAYANAHTLNTAVEDGEFRTILNNGLVLNDGIGVEMASKMLYGEGYPENLNGTDFTPRYIGESQQQLKIYLLGARPGVAGEAARRWQQRFPHQHFVGAHDGYFDESEIAAICDEIRATGANLLIVAMGNPLQEKWIAGHMTRTGATVAIGVGALFDFVSERVPRAPLWMRKLRFEWLYRLMIEPRRMFRRYVIGNAQFLWRAWRRRHRS